MSAYLLVPSSAVCLPYRYQRIDHLARLHHSSPDHSDKHPLRLTLIHFQILYHDGQYCLNVALGDQSTRSEGSRKSCLHSSLLSGSVGTVTLGIVWQPLRRPCYLKSMAVNFPHVSLFMFSRKRNTNINVTLKLGLMEITTYLLMSSERRIHRTKKWFDPIWYVSTHKSHSVSTVYSAVLQAPFVLRPLPGLYRFGLLDKPCS